MLAWLKAHKKKICIGLAVLLALLVVNQLATKLVYDSIFPRYDSQCQAQPPGSYTQLSFSSGAHTLRGKLFQSPGNRLVVIVQGVNSAMQEHYPLVGAILARWQEDVFIFDMTGSGDSEGGSAVGFCQSIYDLNAALDCIAAQYRYEDIYLVGHSRGGYAACCVLAQRNDIRGVVAINAPNSAMDAVVGSAAELVGPIAYGNYPALWLYQAMLFDGRTVSMEVSRILEDSAVPVAIVQGTEDTVMPAERYSIYAHRQSMEGENVRFVPLPGDHTTAMYPREGAVSEALLEAIAQIVPQ